MREKKIHNISIEAKQYSTNGTVKCRYKFEHAHAKQNRKQLNCSHFVCFILQCVCFFPFLRWKCNSLNELINWNRNHFHYQSNLKIFIQSDRITIIITLITYVPGNAKITLNQIMWTARFFCRNSLRWADEKSSVAWRSVWWCFRIDSVTLLCFSLSSFHSIPNKDSQVMQVGK